MFLLQNLRQFFVLNCDFPALFKALGVAHLPRGLRPSHNQNRSNNIPQTCGLGRCIVSSPYSPFPVDNLFPWCRVRSYYTTEKQLTQFKQLIFYQNLFPTGAMSTICRNGLHVRLPYYMSDFVLEMLWHSVEGLAIDIVFPFPIWLPPQPSELASGNTAHEQKMCVYFKPYHIRYEPTMYSSAVWSYIHIIYIS